MKTITVTVAEGKRDFSRLINESAEKCEGIVITNRGKPMAVIVPYSEYQQTRRAEAYKKVLKARAALAKSGLTAASLYKASRAELERK